MIIMAKRRKRTKDKDLDDDDYETEKYEKKSKGRKRASRSKDTSEINKRREAIIVFGIAGILIAAVLGGYYAYAYILYPEEEESSDDETTVTYGVKLEVINDETHNFGASSYHKAHMGVSTQYLLLVSNTGTGTDTINIQYSEPLAGWVIELDDGDYIGGGKLDSDNNIRISAKGSEVLRMTVLVPEQEGNTISTLVTASSKGDTSKESTVECRTQIFDLGDETSKSGDRVEVYYTLVDRGVDSGFNSKLWVFNQANSFPFTIGEGVIPGFSEMAENMRKDETKVWKIPVDLCYGNDKTDTKPDGALMYEMVMLDLDAEG